MRVTWALFTIAKEFLSSQTIYSSSLSQVSLLTGTTISSSITSTRINNAFTFSSTSLQMAKPKSGNIVDSYQTVSVNCAKCRTRLFRYKKKNGTKSNLVKCYIERISEDCVNLVDEKKRGHHDDSDDWICPICQTRFGKDSMIHGRPAIKLVGGKIQMTKK